MVRQQLDSNHLLTTAFVLCSSPCSECVSMMLLPSGRSNSDVYPLQNATNNTAGGGAGPGNGNGTGPGLGGPGSGAGGGVQSKPLLLTRTSSPQLTTLPTTNGSIAHATPTRSNGCPSQPGITAIATPAIATTGTPPPHPHPGTEATTTDLVSAGIGIGGNSSVTGIYGPLLGQSHGSGIVGMAGNWPEIDGHLEAIQEKLKPGWSVHVGKEGRLYYCK